MHKLTLCIVLVCTYKVSNRERGGYVAKLGWEFLLTIQPTVEALGHHFKTAMEQNVSVADEKRSSNAR